MEGYVKTLEAQVEELRKENLHLQAQVAALMKERWYTEQTEEYFWRGQARVV
jgi:hypothetical protein